MRCNDISRDGKGTRRKGHREVNWAEGIDIPGESDNPHTKEEFGNEGEMITKTTGGPD